MGCSSSKLDDLPAVALCRHRCEFLNEAITQRYALSQSHIAYIHSLKAIGVSLNNFIDHNVPKLEIPCPKMDDSAKIQACDDSHLSDSGSHLHFLSDSDDNDDDDDSDDGVLELHNAETERVYYMNYNATMPSVVYEEKPTSSETMRVSEFNGYGTSSIPYYGYSNNGYSMMPEPAESSYSSRLLPPPPPSPPKPSAWDFFNPFEVYEGFYPDITPNRDLGDLRDEGMPELEEDEGLEQEVVKEVQGDQKLAEKDKGVVGEEGQGGKDGKQGLPMGPSNDGVENEGVEDDVHVLEKKVVDDQGKLEDQGKSKGPSDVCDVVKEIEAQFEKAYESGNEMARILEVGRLPYKHKYASKLLHVVSPSLSVVSSQPSTSRSDVALFSTDNSGPACLGIDEDLAMRAKNLSAILQKLYLWERKLYNEVKAEEKMRVVHDRKHKRLKRLDERGAEPDKVDSTRRLVRSLSTKIRIAIQVVDRISVTINKIRDEELWPQLSELIKGLTKMYRCMLECHRAQCQAIREAGSFAPIASGDKLSDDRLEATLQLEHDIINWTSRFSSWISAQKGFIRALNGWLLKFLLYEPEETPDGIAPFSPSRIGAPSVFVVCNQWAEAMESISEKEVLDSMRVFANGVLQLWEQDKLKMHQRMIADKDLERKVRLLDREDQKIHREIHALEKKVVVASGDSYSLSVPVYQGDTNKNIIQASLLHVFEAMERFTAESTKAYEELLQHSEEISVGSG